MKAQYKDNFFNSTLRFFRHDNCRPAYGKSDVALAQEAVDEWNGSYAEDGESYELITRNGIHMMQHNLGPAWGPDAEPETHYIVVCRKCGEGQAYLGEGSDLCFNCNIPWDKSNSDRFEIWLYYDKDAAESHDTSRGGIHDSFAAQGNPIPGVLKDARAQLSNDQFGYKAAKVVKFVDCSSVRVWILTLDSTEEIDWNPSHNHTKGIGR